MSRARLTVVTANIGRGVSTPVAAHNIRAVVNGFKPKGLRRTEAAYGWQEIDEADRPDEHGILHKALRQQVPGCDLVGFGTAVPLAVPPGWDVVHERVDHTCPGRPKVTPARVVVQALIEHQDTGIRVVLMNGHYPHGAPDLWAQCQASWVRYVDEWSVDKGYTVVTTRDRNMAGNGQSLSPWEVPQLPKGSIDKISVIQAAPGPRAVRVVAGKPRTVNLGIDGHDAHGVPLTFTALPR